MLNIISVYDDHDYDYYYALLWLIAPLKQHLEFVVVKTINKLNAQVFAFFLGVYGSVTQIYREGDDEVNFKSEYAVAIMRNRPASKTEDKTTSSSAGKQQAARFSSKDDRHRVQPVPNVSQPQDRKSPMKDQNRLSPTARSFVSRCSPPLPVQVPHSRTMPSPVYPSKPVPSFDHTRKAYWQPAPVYPVANMQAHNFILAHEIARFEAHMKAQRMAVQTHYYKSPFPPAASRRMPVQYKTIHLPVQPTTSNGHLRVQVGA